MTIRRPRCRLAAALFVLAAGACRGEPSAAAPSPQTHGGEEHDGEDHDGKDHDGEGHDDDIVRLSATAVERAGIRVEPATRAVIGTTIDVPAEVQLNPDRVAHVTPLTSGQLREVRVTLGDQVTRGQPLAVLRSVELGRARAEYRRARAMLEVAESNFERQKRLRDEGIASQRAYLEALFRRSEARAERDAALARLQVFGVRGGTGPDMPLEAPIDGTIIERHATRGENVGPDDTVFVVADTRVVWVLGRVYERHVPQVAVGMDATLALRAFPGRTWSGKVTYVASTLDEKTRTLPVRVEIDNRDGTLRPGLFGTLHLHRAEEGEEPTAAVPEPAVQTIRDETVVFVPGDEPGTFRAVPVTTGRRAGGRVAILEGLAPGTPVVVAGAFVLKSQLVRDELGEGHAH